MGIHNEITRFADRERKEAMKAKAEEKNVVSIDPDSYIAKEIKYQTAIEHQILEETRKQTKMLERVLEILRGGTESPSHETH